MSKRLHTIGKEFNHRFKEPTINVEMFEKKRISLVILKAKFISGITTLYLYFFLTFLKKNLKLARRKLKIIQS